jgi:hypothetical protein
VDRGAVGPGLQPPGPPRDSQPGASQVKRLGENPSHTNVILTPMLHAL